MGNDKFFILILILNFIIMLISEFHALYKKEGLSNTIISKFQSFIWGYYKNHTREFPWRYNDNPYHVFISEMMLQQTSTTSVLPKYMKFLKKYPSFEHLSNAPQDEVVQMWQGLGYNRRAIWTKKIAEKVVKDYDSQLPDDPKILQSFKGIGEATSGEISAFAFNKPVIIVNEVNIKRVYIYFFFFNAKEGTVTNGEIKEIVQKTVDNTRPREWYYALMDYGVMLKNDFPKIHKKSSSYKKQAPFKGSNREVRGKILRYMLKNKSATVEQITADIKSKKSQIRNNLDDMCGEGFLILKDSQYFINKKK